MTTPDLLERMAEALRTADKCMTYFGSEPERCDDEEAAAWLQIREALAAYDARGAQGEVDEGAAFDLLRILLTSARNSRPLAPMLNEWLARARLPKEAE